MGTVHGGRVDQEQEALVTMYWGRGATQGQGEVYSRDWDRMEEMVDAGVRMKV